MTKKKYEEKLHLDVDFEEALERFTWTDPQEMHANLDKQKRKKRPPDDRSEEEADGQSQAVVRLRDARQRQRHC